MALRRGDVVLVHYPYSSGTGSKLRPALVVQPDHNNQRLTNIILAPITTTTHRSGEPTQYLIDGNSAEGRAAGVRRLGQLPAAAMHAVDDCLKAALGLVVP